jgi:hypothetical protein
MGQQISISTAITVTALGVIGDTGGASGILALYDNSGSGGKPGVLQAQTGSTAIAAGKNTIGVTPKAIAAGTYWIMGEYNATCSICVDTSSSNTLDYATESYDTVPATFPTPTSFSSVDINYYVVGQD